MPILPAGASTLQKTSPADLEAYIAGQVITPNVGRLNSLASSAAYSTGVTVYASAIYTAPLLKGPKALAAGQLYLVGFNQTNPGAASLQIGSFPPKPIEVVDSTGTALTLAGGEITPAWATVLYDGTEFIYSAPVARAVAVSAVVTLTQAEFAARDEFYLPSAGETVTLPCSSTLSPNGEVRVMTVGGAATIQTTGGCTPTDTIVQNGASGASITVAEGSSVTILTNGAGAFYATGGAGAAPTGPAGGDLGGSYPTPTVTTGAHLGAATVPPSALASGAAASNLGYPPLNPANNLSEVTAATARTNLGLGTAATQNTGTSGATIPFLNGTLTFSGADIFSAAGAASTPGLLINGAIYTAGTGTTAWPQLLVQPSGTTSSSWNAGGTLIGANAPSGFGGDLIQIMFNGSTYFRVDVYGSIHTNGCEYIGPAADVAFTRYAAHNFALGCGDVAAPPPYTISVPNVLTGTSNAAGANFTIAGSEGTGTGAGGDILLKTAKSGSTGSSQNALATALTLSHLGVPVLPSFTTANLPASPGTGAMAVDTDANAACTFGAAPTGGGSTVCKVWYNGAAWVEG